MQRLKLLIEYDGTPFLGWQTQTGGNTVQDKIERAFFDLLKYPVKTYCAGRTDTGVHATGQVIHCDLIQNSYRSPHRLREGLNYYLQGNPIVVLEAFEMPDHFHARFDAVQRHYRYKILNRRAPTTLQTHRVWHIRKHLNIPLMQQAAQDFLGTHDFTTFRDVECQSPSPIRTIDGIFLEQYGDEIHICVHAKSFLHHQIRSMVGTVAKIGMEQLPENYIQTALRAKDRQTCGPVAPPDGLYFEKVFYP